MCIRDRSDPDCAQVSTPSAGCKLGEQLTFGVDYVLSLADNNTVSFVPLKPLKPAQGYMLVMTTDLKDSSGKSVQGSTTWDLVRLDINTNPLATDAQLQLQGLVNSLVNPLISAGYEREELTYVSAFTTQSIANSLDTIKKVMISEFAARAGAGDPTAGQALPAIVVGDADEDPNAAEALNLLTAEAVAGAVQAGKQGLPEQTQAFIDATDFSALESCAGLAGTASGQLSAQWGALNEFAVGVSTAILTPVSYTHLTLPTSDLV